MGCMHAGEAPPQSLVMNLALTDPGELFWGHRQSAVSLPVQR
jgi:hypothetical protein